MAGLFVTDMTPEQVANARKWIDALRSGKYEQTKGRLHKDGKYCCLGVGCDVLGMDLDVIGDAPLLGEIDQQLLGVRTNWGECSTTHGGLSYLNDTEGYTFARIADVIEAELALVVEVPA